MEQIINNMENPYSTQMPEINKEQDVKAAHLSSNPMNGLPQTQNISVVTAILKKGRLSVGVYHTAFRTTTEAVDFDNAANARNYAYLLKKRHGIFISRRSYNLIAAEVKRTAAVSSRAQARAAAEAAAAAAQEPKAEEPAAPAKPKRAKRAKAKKPAEADNVGFILEQYRRMKAKHPDAIILFRAGDFYEMYSEDAVEAARILGITLTHRDNGAGDSIELAGFPKHALDVYLRRLVREAKRVAICEQLNDAEKVDK